MKTFRNQSGSLVIILAIGILLTQSILVAELVSQKQLRFQDRQTRQVLSAVDTIDYYMQRYISMPLAIRTSVVAAYQKGLNQALSACLTTDRPNDCVDGQIYPVAIYSPSGGYPVSGPDNPDFPDKRNPVYYSRDSVICLYNLNGCPIQVYSTFRPTCPAGSNGPNSSCDRAASIQVTYTVVLNKNGFAKSQRTATVTLNTDDIAPLSLSTKNQIENSVKVDIKGVPTGVPPTPKNPPANPPAPPAPGPTQGQPANPPAPPAPDPNQGQPANPPAPPAPDPIQVQNPQQTPLAPPAPDPNQGQPANPPKPPKPVRDIARNTCPPGHSFNNGQCVQMPM